MRRPRHAVESDRRAIAAVLAGRTQAQPLLSAKEVLRILGWPDRRRRFVQRQTRAIRARGCTA